MNLVLLGPPGAGKGTQAKLLSKGLNLEHISTGDMLREEMDRQTELGKEAKQYVLTGELVPDRLVTRMIEKKIFENSGNTGFLLDGFPRNESQAESLDEMLAGHGLKLDRAIYLDADKPVIIQRLTGRRVCQNCGINYHITNMPPKQEGICDQCGAKLFLRKDDNEETIENRLKVYNENTAKVIDYYQAKGILKKVDANQDAGRVYDFLVKFFSAGKDT
jgi:adenylate kinase